MFVRTESFREYIQQYPIITAIVCINIIVYLATFLPFLPNNSIILSLIGVNFLIGQGELWRLVTPIFLHIQFTHFIMNTIAVIIFSPFLERLLGKMGFINLYLFSGIAGNLATFIFLPATYTHLGASGSFYGIFGFYFALILFRKHSFPKQIRQSIIVILVLGILFTAIQPNINWIGHIFGAIGGFGFGYYFLHFGRGKYQS
ncbi:MAG TPA: rhomboid family intramembrane serine protease [Bacillus sp. (in: firmicutes)]|uniref:rhomboid family intramembrane serine protease n=1 Tax=Bacillus litorisediminis TaxID=2922713 RepID=UPI001FAB595E|nr:rhomboid family intramembrane serine protease [Bacillus litorisediminis]HWO76781.1 rhomboid family intramembrane serine protease [Bacillus sp. (in: firmicutes)]